MVYNIIFTAAFALVASAGFSEPLKTGRPDAYTRGIGRLQSGSDSMTINMTNPNSKLKTGRPEELTRGIGRGTNYTPAEPSSKISSKTVSKVKPGRPDGYTRGIGPSGGQE